MGTPGPGIVFLCFLVAAVTASIPLSAVTFLKLRVRRKRRQLVSLARAPVGSSGEPYEWIRHHFEAEQPTQAFFLPVGLCGFVVFLGVFNLLLGGETYVSTGYSLMLGGTSLPEHRPDLDPYEITRWRSLLAISMAFAGGYLWVLQDLIRRLVNGDLFAGTYYGASARLLLAQASGLLLAFFLVASPGAKHTLPFLPVFAFLAGMFPDQVLAWVRQRFDVLTQRSSERSHDLPLDMIEGLSPFHRARLAEVGIDNAQNLAAVGVMELALRTPFPPSILLDWVAQAKLYLYFRSRLVNLREAGVRTVLDLKVTGQDPQHFEAIAAEHQALSRLSLELAYRSLVADPAITELEELSQTLAESDSLEGPSSGT